MKPWRVLPPSFDNDKYPGWKRQATNPGRLSGPIDDLLSVYRLSPLPSRMTIIVHAYSSHVSHYRRDANEMMSLDSFIVKLLKTGTP